MLIPDPCFIETVRRASGAKRLLVHVANAGGAAKQLTITTVSKPEWLDVEGAMMGDTLTFKKGAKLPLVVNINTDHRFFPTQTGVREEVRFEFAEGEPLTLFVNIQEIISTVQTFRGTFAMDFGTTNTCYAWKERVGDHIQMLDLVKPPQASREVPTLIRYKDISNRAIPLVEIGHHARDYNAHNSGRNFSYAISIKRSLGIERELVILDDRSGMENNRYQRYRPEEIAAHIIKEILREAEGRIGQRIEQVVATFPILYNAKKLAALKQAFRLAFEALNREWREDRLVLRLDETNAAAFNYVYGQLLDEFRRFSVQSRQHRLLSYDFGGGTVDVSLVDVDLTRDQTGRISIKTHTLGITGDRYFAGDIVTLAVVKLMKLRLAAKISAVRSLEAAKAAKDKEAASQQAAAAANPWAIAATPAKPAAAAGDPWASLSSEPAAAAAGAAPVAEEDENPETADITNMTTQARQEAAWAVMVANADVVDAIAASGLGSLAAVERLVADGTKRLSPLEIRELAQSIEDAVDLLVPTRWKVLEAADDLIAMGTARKLFYELWIPAEVMKIKSVTDPSRSAALTEPLHKIAKYAGVRPEALNGITVTEEEINAAIDLPLRRSIGKAAHLLKTATETGGTSAGGLSFGGLSFGGGAAVADRPVTVLLAGNSARLPIVRRLVAEICQIDDARIVMDPNGLKATVAQGACEEHILRRDFDGGLIQYDAGDFTSRIPYAIGLFNKELSLLGFAGGFAPVMPRGTAVDSQVLLTEALQVVHAQAKELTLFAYYHDHELGLDPASAGPMASVQPYNLGWFDLSAAEPQPWAGEFTAEVAAQIASAGKAFALVLVLDKNRDLTLVVPLDKKQYKLKAAREVYDDLENPFSGVH